MSANKHDRRRFLGKVAIGAAGAGLIDDFLSHVASLDAETRQRMPYRTLGRTGEKVSLLGLGGYHIGVQADEQESIRIIRAAIDNGVNFMDNCWDYNGGQSEIRMGKALRDGYRQKVFLMTKINGRTAGSATSQLEQSLKRLEVDHLDLLQFHQLTDMSEPSRIFGPGGAFEAVMAAKKAGKVRYIGFTGHTDPAVHLKMLNAAFAHGFTFDTVQMPLSLMDAHHRSSFAKEVLPVLVGHRIGVLGMKTLGGNGAILSSGTVTAIECLHYTMNLPTSVVINGCDSMKRLQQGLEAARTFRPLSKAALGALLKKTAMAGKSGQYEPFKNGSERLGQTFV
ncbi:MAG TPA: aldo/keto reductase [Terriglobia bacterium]|nr:aldo/keto reductase [Terriglobia bacterium]